MVQGGVRWADRKPRTGAQKHRETGVPKQIAEGPECVKGSWEPPRARGQLDRQAGEGHGALHGGTINRLVMLLVFAAAWEARRGWNLPAKPAHRDRPWLQTRPPSEALPLSTQPPLRRSCHPPPPASSWALGTLLHRCLCACRSPKTERPPGLLPLLLLPFWSQCGLPCRSLGVCCCG